jgi:hypothetical protein
MDRKACCRLWICDKKLIDMWLWRLKCCRNLSHAFLHAVQWRNICRRLFAFLFFHFFLFFEATFLNPFGTSICVQTFVFYSSSLIIKERLFLLKFWTIVNVGIVYHTTITNSFVITSYQSSISKKDLGSTPKHRPRRGCIFCQVYYFKHYFKTAINCLFRIKKTNGNRTHPCQQ